MVQKGEGTFTKLFIYSVAEPRIEPGRLLRWHLWLLLPGVISVIMLLNDTRHKAYPGGLNLILWALCKEFSPASGRSQKNSGGLNLMASFCYWDGAV